MEKKGDIQKLDQILVEMREISGHTFLVFSADGEWIAGEAANEDMTTAIRSFAASQAETQVRGGWTYFRVDLSNRTEYVMLCSAENPEEPPYVIGRMALGRVRDLLAALREPRNRIGGLRQILTGEIPPVMVPEKCRELHLRPGRYLLFVIQHKADVDGIFLETLRHLFANAPADFVIEMDRTRTALLKDAADIEGEDFVQYAEMIVENLQSEAMTNVWVGYGDPVTSFDALATAYQNACTALTIGTVFYAEDRAYYYQRLGIGRLIHQLPTDLCEMFLREVLGESMEFDLDEETMNTIRKLFDNNLNISETARQLYIHRNTLVYRLERIEKQLGLDIRTFDDAMLFKIAMMVRTHLNERNIAK